MTPGETLVLYTDGVSEAENDAGDEYSAERLRSFIAEKHFFCPAELVNACKEQVAAFRGSRVPADDETLLAIQYAPAAGSNFATA